MPVHSVKGKDGRYYVTDDKGKKHGMHNTKSKAKAQATAMNIAMGYVPKPKKDKK